MHVLVAVVGKRSPRGRIARTENRGKELDLRFFVGSTGSYQYGVDLFKKVIEGGLKEEEPISMGSRPLISDGQGKTFI